MKYHKQFFAHSPEYKMIGDCYRTALACILDIDDPKDVPHFGLLDWIKASSWDICIDLYLEFLGFKRDTYYVRDLIEASTKVQTIFYLLSGKNPRGINHTVVCTKDKMIWDPSHNNDFINQPLNRFGYELHEILPINKQRIWS